MKRDESPLAARRDALLATPTLTLADLARVRGQQESSARAWFYRQKARGALFSVTYSGTTLIPAFQLSRDGNVRPELQGLITPLQAAEFDSWTIWHWLTSPTGWLSGETPEQVSVDDPERARVAADRQSARPARVSVPGSVS